MLKKLRFRPGIVRDTTDYSNEYGWRDCNLIRFRNGFPEQMKGWTKYSTASVIGTIRSMRRTVDLDGEPNLFIGTNCRAYVLRSGDRHDITPIRTDASLGTDPVTTVSGSGIVTIAHTGHGAVVGDYVILSGLATVNGITDTLLNDEHIITEVVDANSFKIDTGGSASGSGAGGGASGNIKHIYYCGRDSDVTGVGWGAGSWGSGGWGVAADASDAVDGERIRMWSFDAYGEDVVFAPRFGPPFYWDATTATNRAVYVNTLPGQTGVPQKVTKLIASERDRHVIALGASPSGSSVLDPMLIRWADQEDVADWTPTTTNTAGDLRLSQGSKIITGVATRQEILVWTDVAVYAMRYIGGEFIFSIPMIANGIDIAGFNSAIAVTDNAFWMSKSGFYIYDGRVSELDCPIEQYIRNDVDWTQGDKIFAGTNLAEGEIFWFYQSVNASNNDKYVVYNYREKLWYYGTLSRTAWIDDKVIRFPLAAAPNGTIFQHEDGLDDNSGASPAALNGYIESGLMEISGDELGDGEHFVFIRKLIPDVTFINSDAASPQVDFTFKASNHPGGAENAETAMEFNRTASTPVELYTTYKNMRLRGRSFILRVAGNGTGLRWRLGTPRIDIRTDGMK